MVKTMGVSSGVSLDHFSTLKLETENMETFEIYHAWRPYARAYPKKATAISAGWANFHTARLQVSILMLLCLSRHVSEPAAGALLAADLLNKQIELQQYKLGARLYEESKPCKS